jgi:hypothetical protein
MGAVADFLRKVLPSQGKICLVRIKNKRVSQIFVENEYEAESVVGQLNRGDDAYFSMSRFLDTSSRRLPNSIGLRSYFLDLDCGEGKPYEKQSDALQALNNFCEQTCLPKPTVVNSGNGLHVYWALNQDTSVTQWQSLAASLKTKCGELGLAADSAVTSDAVRILRVPTTLNYKDPDNPKPVEVLYEGQEIEVERFAACVGRGDVASSTSLPVVFSCGDVELTKALSGRDFSSIRTSFQNILLGRGCHQLLYVAEEQQQLSEPLWRAGLSIAQFCEDRDIAIHAISNQHPGYDFNETEKKASGCGGPHRCETFEELNPGGCQGCPSFQKITSPIMLGRVIEETKKDLPIVVEGEEEVDAKSLVPKPYMIGEDGGIYWARQVEGQMELEKACDYTLVVRSNSVHATDGAVLNLTAFLPRDRTTHFQLPLTALSDAKSFKELLFKNEIMQHGDSMKATHMYIIEVAKRLQKNEDINMIFSQFGWTDEETFVLGDKEYYNGDSRAAIPSRALHYLATRMQSVGSLDGWRKIARVYEMEGFEKHAFCMCLSFGSFLFPYFNKSGGVVSLYGPGGSGKTTITEMMNSVWGHPHDLSLRAKDTVNSIYHRLGVMHNLPVVVDEITSWTPEQVSEFAYSVTEGRPKNRLEARVNAERLNDLNWATTVTTTSNESLHNKISSVKRGDAEMYRILEMEIERSNNLTPTEANDIFKQLNYNYGLFGPLLLDYALKNTDALKENAVKYLHEADKDFKFSGPERFWSAMVACARLGAFMAVDALGIVNYNFPRIYEVMKGIVGKNRGTVDEVITGAVETMGGYLNEFGMNNTLIIESAADSRTGLFKKARREPKGPLYIRYEPDTETIFILASHMKSYCVKYRISYNSLMDELHTLGVMKANLLKRLGKGTNFNTPAVRCLVLDANRLPSLDGGEDAD